MKVAAFVVIGLMLGAATAQTDDLAALARKEKERRAKLAKPSKVLTEEDSKEAAAKGAGSVTALGTSATTPNPDAPPAPDAQRDVWKKRADAARAAITAAENRLKELERAVQAVRSDQAPLSAEEAQDPLRLQKKEAKIFQMNKDVEAQKGAVDAARKALAALEEQARQEGVPAGWLR